MKKIIITESQLNLLFEQGFSPDNSVKTGDSISDLEAYNQLTDTNGEQYFVRLASEKEATKTECSAKPIFSCINSIFSGTTNGVEYPSKQRGMCIARIKSTDTAFNFKKNYLEFFESQNIFRFTNMFKTEYEVGSLTVIGAVYQGKWDCSTGKFTDLLLHHHLIKSGSGVKDEKSLDHGLELKVFDSNGNPVMDGGKQKTFNTETNPLGVRNGNIRDILTSGINF